MLNVRGIYEGYQDIHIEEQPGHGSSSRNRCTISDVTRGVSAVTCRRGMPLRVFLAGMVGMHWTKFLAYNTLGAALWVCTWSAFGYFAGQNIDERQFYAVVESLRLALDANDVGEREKNELLRMLAPMKRDIVTR